MEQPTEKKTKKSFIIEFLEQSTETDPKKALEAYNASKNPSVSPAFFGKTWTEIKGSVPKEVKSKNIDIDNREKILALYEEEHALLTPVREYRTARLVENDPEKKKELKAKEDSAMEAVYAKNHQIRALLEHQSK